MELIQSFKDRYDRPPTLIAHAPGRVNLLGEHVDYNGGPVLPVAIDRSVRLALAPSGDELLTLRALDMEEEVIIRLDSLAGKTDAAGRKLPAWACYPAGVAWSLQEAGLATPGFQGVYTSDVPIGAGLSSSAAVEVTFAAAWHVLGGWRLGCLELALRCQRAENAYVGVNCGLMDQFASSCGVEGHAMYFDTRNLEWEAVPLLPGTAIVIADSGMRRALSSSAYNERRAACEEAVRLLQEYLHDITSLRDISPVEFAAYSEYLPKAIRKRAEHVVKEIARVQSAVNALWLKDIQAFGAMMYAGHVSLRDLYEVSTPELDAMVEIARGLPGCWGARLTGAGFGGCTVNLVREDKAPEFIRGMQQAYLQKTGRKTEVYLCRPSAGAGVDSI